MSQSLLYIDTAGSRGLVMLGAAGTITDKLENDNPMMHASFLQPAIKQLLQRNQLHHTSIAAVVVANGPGSYTGLRVGLAGAKGLCYAWQKPLITLSTLSIMARAMQNAVPPAQHTGALLVPMIDARRMEVFFALFKPGNQLPLVAPTTAILDESFAHSLPQGYHYYCAGSGAPKWQPNCPLQPTTFLDIDPLTDDAFAQEGWHALMHQNFANLAYCEPFYAKAFFSTQKNG